MRALITVTPIIALVLSIAACQGDAGPAGEQGPPGPQGPAGAPALVDEATVASLIEQMQERLDTSYTTAAVPPKSTPGDYTKFLVGDAISRYESEGLDATVAYYNARESIDGQWYVFIIDENQTIIAHAPDPDLVGKHVSQALGPNSPIPPGPPSPPPPTRTAPGSTTPTPIPPLALCRPSTPG